MGSTVCGWLSEPLSSLASAWDRVTWSTTSANFQNVSTQGYEVLGTTRVYDLNAPEPIYTEPDGRSYPSRDESQAAIERNAREFEQRRNAFQPAVKPEPKEPEPSQFACDLLDKGLQKAVEETMAFEKGYGRLPAPWEG